MDSSAGQTHCVYIVWAGLEFTVLLGLGIRCALLCMTLHLDFRLQIIMPVFFVNVYLLIETFVLAFF